MFWQILGTAVDNNITYFNEQYLKIIFVLNLSDKYVQYVLHNFM